MKLGSQHREEDLPDINIRVGRRVCRKKTGVSQALIGGCLWYKRMLVDAEGITGAVVSLLTTMAGTVNI